MTWKVYQDENGGYAVRDGERLERVCASAEEAQAVARELNAQAEQLGAERVYDRFVSTQPGQAYRLLPFGPIQRASGGPARVLTAESARAFRLPHFKPPVKLGSHDETTLAGGHIVGLEVREDGLYAVPEWTERGSEAVNSGGYRYHSPEIIWGDGAIEDASTGKWIKGPLIVGDALLHTPALGEATALYTSQIRQQTNEGEIMEETVQVPKGIWDQFQSLFKPAPAVVETQAAATIPDEYSAAMKERDELKAKIEEIQAEKARIETVTRLGAEIKMRLGQEFDGAAADDAAVVLAGMSEDQRDWVMTRLAAMSKRIDYAMITAEIGTSGANSGSGDPRQDFAAAIQAKMRADSTLNYQQAYTLVKAEAPDLFHAYAEYVPGAKEKEG